MRRCISDAEQLAKSLAALADVSNVAIDRVQGYCSATFHGHCVECSLILTGHEQLANAERLKNELPNHAFDLPRQIVADILVTAITSQADGDTAVTIEALLLDD
jgi:hypothetical protein